MDQFPNLLDTLITFVTYLL